MSISSAAFRICLHFGLNPDARMTAHEISERFSIDRTGQVRIILGDAIRMDMMQNVAEPKGRGNRALYAAGPRLLKMRGQA